MTNTAWPRVAASAIFVILALVILLTFRDYGMSWDEQLQNTYGQKLLAYYTTGFQDRSAFSYINLFLYGGFFDLVAAVVNRVSPFGEYETRHLLGGLMFLAGLWGGWKLAKLLAGERAALIALLCLATTPLLYGHGFINPKDSPLAWLLIWASYFSCRLLEAPAKPSWRIVVGLGVSLGLAIGTRVVAVVYLDYLVAVWIAATAARMLGGESVGTALARVKTNTMPLAVALLITTVTTILVWPWAAQEPLNIIAALRAFSHFAFYPKVLWNGAFIPADEMPSTYLPGLLALQLPEYVLGGFGAALIFGMFAWRSGFIRVFAQPKAQQYLFIALSISAPVAGYLLLRPTVYNGLRHFLFIVPPLVIVGAIGLSRVLEVLENRLPRAAVILGILFGLAVARQIVLMIALHPYEYLAYNSFIGGIAGAKDRFELDYWGTTLAESGRDLGAYLAHDPKAVRFQNRTVRVFACGDPTQARHALPKGAELTEVLSAADFYLGMEGVHCEEDFRRPMQRVREVRRRGIPLGYVLDLHPAAAP